MHHSVFRTLLLPAALLLVLISFSGSTLFAQSSAIEPCPATPVPSPGATQTLSGPTKTAAKASRIEINSSLNDDPVLEKLLAPYRVKVRELSEVIGTFEGDMTKNGVGSGSLGNLVSDALLSQARKRSSKSIAIALTNGGGLRRTTISAGEIPVNTIFELLPFDNELITLDVTGSQLLQLAQLSLRDAQSGAKIKFQWDDRNRAQLISATLEAANGQKQPINPDATYTIVTIDYLYNLKSGAYSLLQEGKDLQKIGLTLRDAVIDYIKTETSIGRKIRATVDDRFEQIGPGPKTATPND